MSESYPERPPSYWAQFMRVLTSSDAASQIGPQACYLLALVVGSEDSLGYARAPVFWDEQLTVMAGMGSRSVLQRHRQKAVLAGWLHYEPGRKGVPGKYWVCIPDNLSGDHAVHLNDHLNLRDRIDTENRQKTGRK